MFWANKPIDFEEIMIIRRWRSRNPHASPDDKPTAKEEQALRFELRAEAGFDELIGKWAKVFNLPVPPPGDAKVRSVALTVSLAIVGFSVLVLAALYFRW